MSTTVQAFKAPVGGFPIESVKGQFAVIEMEEKGTANDVPGEPGIWFLIVGDMILFSLLFATFIYYRSLELEIFAVSRQSLNQTYGLINTLVLLTSSWFVASAVQAVRTRRIQTARLMLFGAIACGAVFIGIKILEYSEKFGHGITLTSNLFYTLYFMYTGIHLLHVIIGLGVLAYLTNAVRRTEMSSNTIKIIEGGASFWHLVDILWIILFPLLYLMV